MDGFEEDLERSEVNEGENEGSEQNGMEKRTLLNKIICPCKRHECV
jgi:ABC-type arginine/histidine transport system permease subunit